jgi:ElaB/YqjD/DUF883 family membrane-anchored ribosome-binding protein
MDKKEIIEGNGHVAIHEWSPIKENGEHKTSREIEFDIDETRNVMDEILDTMSGKVRPGALMNRFQDYFQKQENVDRVKDTLTRVGKGVSNSFQRNPLPAIMAATGAVWMLWETTQSRSSEYAGEKTAGPHLERRREQAEEKFSSTKARAEDATAEAKERFSSGLDQARQRGERFISGAKEARENYQRRAGETSENYRRRVEELRQNTMHTYRDSTRRADQAMHDNPILFGAAAVFAGIVAGFFLPETKREKQVAGDLARQTIGKAKESGEKAMETGKEVAHDTTQAASQSIKEKGVTPEQLTRKAEKATNTTPSEKAQSQQRQTGTINTKSEEGIKIETQRTEQKFEQKKDENL